MVPSEILQSVFMIQYANKTASSLYVTIDGSDYLITARHLFDNIHNRVSVEIEIINDKGLVKLNPILLIHDNKEIDIAVLDLGSKNRKENHFDLVSGGYFLTQDTYFVGFPFGLKMGDNPEGVNSGFPLPFVKKGIISGFFNENGVRLIYLDGHNNPGFSGGPVVIEDTNPRKKNKMQVIGIISGYISEIKAISTPFGNIDSSENSGIIKSIGFHHVFEIIKNK